MKTIDLLIIDTQNDFCDPRGALYVQGAEADSSRLADFINKQSSVINNIHITLDSHHQYDIAHPMYWLNPLGNHPEPFTIISVDDVKCRRWVTSKEEDRKHGEDYVTALALKGKYSLCIWPPHCLIGSWGTQIQTDVFNALSDWEITNRAIADKIYKGSNPGTEHYGALEAEIPQSDDETTKMHIDLVEKLNESHMILIAGQALDYCVANTVRQLAQQIGDENIEKLVLLEDCCSSVDPISGISKFFLEELSSKGMKIVKSTDFASNI